MGGSGGAVDGISCHLLRVDQHPTQHVGTVGINRSKMTLSTLIWTFSTLSSGGLASGIRRKSLRRQ